MVRKVKHHPVPEDKARDLLHSVQALSLYFNCNASCPELNKTESALISLLERERSLAGGQIAEALGMALSSVTAMIDRLEERALVSRQRDASDRRVVHVSLTRDGQQLARSLSKIHLEMMRAMLQPLDADEQDAFIGFYRRIAAGLRRKAD